MKDYYLLLLDDPSTPGFVSFSKKFFGTKEQMQYYAAVLAFGNPENETAKAIRAYYAGDKSATHTVAYSKVPVLTPVEYISEGILQLSQTKWEHRNTWDAPYTMRFDEAMIHQLVVCANGEIIRAVQILAKNLHYLSLDDVWMPLRSGFWGNKGILQVESFPMSGDFRINNILYLEEKNYANDRQTAIDDLLCPEKINYTKFCDEIFADG